MLVLSLVIGGAGRYIALSKESAGLTAARAANVARRIAGLRPCDVPKSILQRVARGYFPGRSGDVLTVEWNPNQLAGGRHSTPFPYTQDVPLVLYGPGFIRSGVSSSTPSTLADIAPTLANLLRFGRWPDRSGRVLNDALLPRAQRNGVPRLIFTLVWDGGGDNVLRQWPHAWPHLESLMARGTTFTNATVGSSPSITPAVHGTIGTGAFPSRHGLTDMRLRRNGRIVTAWGDMSPKNLRLRTLGDLWDAARGNAPLVGELARDPYHMGMLGRGAYLPEGDHDIAAITQRSGTGFRTNHRYYSLPSYLERRRGLRKAIARVDQRDGAADHKWMGYSLDAKDPFVEYTPAWSIYQTRKLAELIKRQGFGADAVPDLFYTNYKSTDLAGHFWNMLEPQERADLREQDRQLLAIVHMLNHSVGRDNYVLAVTADHGIVPYPRTTGGWAIESGEVGRDIMAKFDHVDPKVRLIDSNRGYQIFLDHRELRRNHTTAAAIARYLRNYRIADNVTPTNKVLPRFQGRTNERLYLTALTPRELQGALHCARAHHT